MDGALPFDFWKKAKSIHMHPYAYIYLKKKIQKQPIAIGLLKTSLDGWRTEVREFSLNSLWGLKNLNVWSIQLSFSSKSNRVIRILWRKNVLLTSVFNEEFSKSVENWPWLELLLLVETWTLNNTFHTSLLTSEKEVGTQFCVLSLPRVYFQDLSSKQKTTSNSQPISKRKAVVQNKTLV